MNDPRQKMMMLMLLAALIVLGMLEGVRCWCDARDLNCFVRLWWTLRFVFCAASFEMRISRCEVLGSEKLEGGGLRALGLCVQLPAMSRQLSARRGRGLRH